MSPDPSSLHLKPILSLNIQEQKDLVAVRQRARQLSALLGFNQQDQTRIATAVSEIARNARQYAGGGRLDFAVDLEARPQFFWMRVSDHGPGIGNMDSVLAGTYVSPTGLGIGLAGSSRLMDEFHTASQPGKGSSISFGKAIPTGAKPLEKADISRFCMSLSQQPDSGAAEELARQNRDLLQTLDMLRARESELEKRQHDLSRLNLELEETNRGVLALYAELDEKANDLRRAGEMKSSFLSHVSHEFRTPVNAILALTRLLLQRTDGDLLPEQEKQVAYIRDAAQQLFDMVNDLLDLAKVGAGKIEIRPSLIDVNQFLGATRALMRPLAANEAVSLVFEEIDPAMQFQSDESKAGQILRNLISNALKFTQRGEVRVSAALSAAADAVVFNVKDTGIGIAPEDQDRVFHEFTQIENPIQKHVKGTGLGLHLSRRFATLLGGTLSLESALGTGSKFTLTLPLVSSPGVVASHSPQQMTGGNTILVVDDQAASRYVTQQLLKGTRHRIVEATGVEAIERTRTDAPALILLDLVMPGRSGFEVLDDLKSDKTTREIPVVIHSSSKMTEADYARLAGRQAAFLPKGPSGRRPALLAIREILGEPHLFSAEPEFL